MPKVKQTKPVEVVEEPPKEEKRAPVFRLFECLVHLEQARDHVAKVGIIPGHLGKALLEPGELTEVVRQLEILVSAYKKSWICEQFGGTK